MVVVDWLWLRPFRSRVSDSGQVQRGSVLRTAAQLGKLEEESCREGERYKDQNIFLAEKKFQE